MVERGQMVTIPKGTPVHSLHPQGDYVAATTRKIKVHAVHPAWTDLERSVHHPAQVSWAGRGGYWCYADLDRIPEAKVEPGGKGGAGEVMDPKGIKAFLSDNLSIAFDKGTDWVNGCTKLTVKLLLCGEEISSDSLTVKEPE